jgi:2-oxoglutarate dehydrogenase E2 component (dihydrolipoamide succinyltransferase)
MANIEVTLPQMGEGVIEATITRWLVEKDSYIEEDEPIVEIATDKVDSEIPSPAKGKIIRFFFNEGETPKVGDVIAIISSNKNGSEKNIQEELTSQEKKELNVINDTDGAEVLLNEPFISNKTGEKSIISPFIRNYAKQRGISYNELKGIPGSGNDGEIRKEDVLNYFKNHKALRHSNMANGDKSGSISKPERQSYSLKEGEEFIEIDKTRKLIAEHMVRSVHEAPHVTSIIESDITHIVQWRERSKDAFLVNNGVKLTYTPIITEVVVKALKEFPGINVSFIQDKIVLKKYINIGIATALPDHNLIVPVVRDADKKNLEKLAIEVSDLTFRARNNSLKPGETNGGTFTITNLGMVGNITGTPIINQPESAILAVGAIKKRPWAIELNGEYTIGVRDILTLSLSYDHRVIDGALGGAFLSRIGQLLESYTPDF